MSQSHDVLLCPQTGLDAYSVAAILVQQGSFIYHHTFDFVFPRHLGVPDGWL